MFTILIWSVLAANLGPVWIDAQALAAGLQEAQAQRARGSGTWDETVTPLTSGIVGTTSREQVQWDGAKSKVVSHILEVAGGISLDLVADKGRTYIITPAARMMEQRTARPGGADEGDAVVHIFPLSPDERYRGPGSNAGLLPSSARLDTIAIESASDGQVIATAESLSGRTLRFACRPQRGFTLDWLETIENGRRTMRYDMTDYREVDGVVWPFQVERRLFAADGTVNHVTVRRLVQVALGGEPHPESDYQLTITDKSTVIDERVQGRMEQVQNTVP